LHTKILPFVQTDDGKEILNDYLHVINEKFPWYVDEMKGLANGSGIGFDLVRKISLNSVYKKFLIQLNFRFWP